MKTKLTVLILLLVAACTRRAAAEVSDSAVCLVVRGEFENAFYDNGAPCLVEVIRNGEVQDSVRLTRFRRRFFYAFERDCCYTLRVSKPGFAPMLIAVDTRIPMDNVLYRFDFSARLITEKRAKTFDHETLQLPYAQITFDKTAGGFLADASYTETIKTRLALRGSVR